MVELRSEGFGQREIARRLRVGLGTVQLWLGRAASQEPLSDRPSGRAWNRSDETTERLVLEARERLKGSALGETGAEAVRRELLAQGMECPSARTVGRILARRGALDGKRRARWPAPPPGWYLPDVGRKEAELDSFDAVVGLVIRGGTDVEVLNGVSLHGGLVASWPEPSVTTETTLLRIVEHWKEFGLPAYAQFDNDTRFQGPHHFPDALGRVVRLCLSLGVTPVFAPPREPGFQNAVESLNGRWQAKVWNRFEHADLEGLRQRSGAYVEASRKRLALRIEGAPPRVPFPEGWTPKERYPLCGKVVFVRRADERGRIGLLGRTFETEPNRPHRLVRAEVLYDEDPIDLYALRRAESHHQPLIRRLAYAPKKD